MEHKKFDEIERLARIVPIREPKMSRRERLDRWATLLEQHGQKPLKALRQIEFLPGHEREAARSDNSPLSIAFADPVLRQEGLASDRFGDALAFFELPVGQAHYLLCDCHYQGSMTGRGVATRIRSIARRVTFGELWNRMRGRLASA